MNQRKAQDYPEPRRWPLVGHLLELDQDKPVQWLAHMAKEHGPIYKLQLPGKPEVIVLSGLDQLEEAFDEERFEKVLPGGLRMLRPLSFDGLFTAEQDEPNWGKAHRILMPAFGMSAMRRYHAMMLDVATQMVEKWARLPSKHEIDVSSDMTRLTLDVIALCGFGYRFNSFYTESMHPFVKSMVRSLEYAMHSANFPDFVNKLMFRKVREFEEDVGRMHQIVDEVIAERKAQGRNPDATDLLSLMLHAKDPETGETLSDENIRYQIVTFLIAGHETTSSLLSFALYFLMQQPEILAEARAEVDRILPEPGQLPTFEEVKEMRYLEQILFESLRLWPTAPGFALKAKKSTTIDGYSVEPENHIVVNLSGLHRDPQVWDEPEVFRPERFAPEEVARRPVHAWKPFGNGVRACIGRQFAIHEAKMVLSLIIRRFDLRNLRPNAPLDVREMLTFKPEGLLMRVQTRENIRPEELLHRSSSKAETRPSDPESSADSEVSPAVAFHGTPMTVAFGSNMGSTQLFAKSLAQDATRLGYQVTLRSLNECVNRIPTEGAFVVVTASYNGSPPDNAKRFCEWLSSRKEGDLAGVKFAVFGCGHKDWAATYQAIPQQINRGLEEAGAERLFAIGEGDAREDIESDMLRWKGEFWPSIQEHFALSSELPTGFMQENELSVEELSPPPPQPTVLNEAYSMEIVENTEMVDMSHSFSRSKRHIRIALPEGVEYQAGDYLVVQPVNASEWVEMFAQRLGWDLEQIVVLRRSGPATLPFNRPLSLRSLLMRYVELQRPVTQAQLQQLVEHVACPPEREKLRAWTGTDKAGKEAFQAEVADKALSLPDLIHMFPSMQLNLQVALSLLPPLQPRTYSIASSPLLSPRHCDLTVSVLAQPARSGIGEFQGVCSNYLAQRSVGTSVLAWVKRPSPRFAPPADASVPMVMIGAGTGLAPFRGFLQERSAEQSKTNVAKSQLFFGCDHPEVDFLYQEELKTWERNGIVSLYPAFSESPDGDVFFVQHRLWAEKEEVKKSLSEGAYLYICGDGRFMAPAVLETLARIYAEMAECSQEEAQEWLQSMRESGRLLEDVWAG